MIFEIKLNDGSVFSIEGDKVSALKMKLKVDSLTFDEFKDIFVKKVEEHWNKRTVPTKFPWDWSWEKDLENDIWHELYYKLQGWEKKEEKKAFGYSVASLVPVKWFSKDVKREKAKLISNGVALKDNKLILRHDTKEAKKYWKISERFSEILKKETKKEFLKRKTEAINKFKNQAELAEKVFYQYVRPYLMGILLSRATKGKSGSIITSDNSVNLVKEGILVNKKFDSGRMKEG